MNDAGLESPPRLPKRDVNDELFQISEQLIEQGKVRSYSLHFAPYPGMPSNDFTGPH
jgi:hypothetical protein